MLGNGDFRRAGTDVRTAQRDRLVPPPPPRLTACDARASFNVASAPALPGSPRADAQGQWRGLDVDVCRAIAAAVLGDATKVRFTPLTSPQRFTALQTGEIDVLSRVTTITFQRDVQLGIEFPATNWYDGSTFLVRKALNLSSLKGLDGATICITARHDERSGRRRLFPQKRAHGSHRS